MFDEALKALKLRVRIMEINRGIWGIFKYNRPIKPMCQLCGEFIEIYVKTDVEGFQYYIKKSRKESRRPKKSWSKDNCAESS